MNFQNNQNASPVVFNLTKGDFDRLLKVLYTVLQDVFFLSEKKFPKNYKRDLEFKDCFYKIDQDF